MRRREIGHKRKQVKREFHAHLAGSKPKTARRLQPQLEPSVITKASDSWHN